MLNEESLYYCRVCGYREDDSPWGDDGKSPTFNFCRCCGVEFGYQDSSLTGIRKYRQEWIQVGALWFDPESKPEGWSLDEQMKNIPAEFV
ncbi:MAG TPA: hypothetical protein VNQ79_00830 [Blastocatellia bacterium]|nr:hypothetical protein [Blastocatellia bacterium]